jgi:hypothetical protein
MTFRPQKAAFAPPWSVRLPSTLYFVVASVVGLGVVLAPLFPMDSWLYREVVLADQTRVVTSQAAATILFVSALASVIRQTMAGVIVHPDGIETREILPLGMPRVKKLAWAQIDRVAIPRATEAEAKATPSRTAAGTPIKKIRLDLWNGQQQFLPDVAKVGDLALAIERVALARAIPIEGGTGLVDEILGGDDEG